MSAGAAALRHLTNQGVALKFPRSVLAWLVLGLPAAVFAQAPQAVGATYIDAEVGTGKVGLRCPANTYCSRVDSSGVIRLGHRFDTSWAVELAYAHIDSDWGIFGRNYAAEVEGFGIGAAYTAPLSASVGARVRFGAAVNHLKLQPAVGFLDQDPGTVTTNSVKPYLGLSVSWQFARHWSTSLNADWTRADLRETAGGPKQTVTVRTFGAGMAFNF
jgi:hypothetical protein